MSLHDAWDAEAPNWIRWAREPGHDTYWRFHRDSFLSLLPPPGRLTFDLGCGEGRLTRDLRDRGHRVIGVDQSPSMLAAAREADPGGEYVETNAAALPFDDGSADLAIAFMSLMDMDEMPGAIREAARVVGRRGVFVAAVVHPINSAGDFVPPDGDEAAPYVIQSYRGRRRYTATLEASGLRMTFNSNHYTLEDYARAIAGAGLIVHELREIYDDANPRWSRVPLFLHLRAVKAG